MRKMNFENGEYYHIYNRGVDQRDIFMDEKDYIRFIRSMREFNDINLTGSIYRKDYLKSKIHNNGEKDTKCPMGHLVSGVEASEADAKSPKVPLMPGNGIQKLVEYICYSLIGKHYHFILKQISENGISKFMHRLEMGYAKYFNHKYDRTGALFQGPFRSIHVKKEGYLLWLSGYIHGNPEIHKITKAQNWPWSSYMDYLGLRNGTLCSKEDIFNQFKSKEDYKKIVDIIIKESGSRKKELADYLLEEKSYIGFYGESFG